MHPQIYSQDSLHFTITLAVLPGAVVPHMKRGTAALELRHCRDLSDRWGLGGIYTFSLPPQCLSLLPTRSVRLEHNRVLFSLSSIGDLELPTFYIDFPINHWKKVPNSIREQIL